MLKKQQQQASTGDNISPGTQNLLKDLIYIYINYK